MSRDAKKKKPDPAGPLVTLKTAAFTFETALSHQCTSISLSIYLSEETKTIERTKSARRREGQNPRSPACIH
jgi:hypothetical protein